jgi:hypothetical protein
MEVKLKHTLVVLTMLIKLIRVENYGALQTNVEHMFQHWNMHY